MATATKPTLVENITVHQVGKYGVRVDEKTWYGVNEPLTPSNFVPNEGYKVSVVVSKTGKKYINEILGVAQDVPQEAAAPVAAPKAAAPAPVTTTTTPASTGKNPTRAGFGQQLTDYDMAIQRQIARAGIWQAVASNSAIGQMCVNADEHLALIRKFADAGLKYIQE